MAYPLYTIYILSIFLRHIWWLSLNATLVCIQQATTEEEPEGVFAATAVSEEKIEEATARAKKGIANTQSVAVDLWGQATYEIEKMGDVITKKATEQWVLLDKK